MYRFALAMVLALASTISGPTQQQKIKPTAPGSSGDPNWQRLVTLSDGRTLVTVGGMALDVEIAMPKLPAEGLTKIPGKILEGYLAGSFTHEFGLGELKVKEAGRTYVAPSGVLVSATYVDFLRRTMSASTVRLRMKGNMEPIVIMANGSAVGVLMP